MPVRRIATIAALTMFALVIPISGTAFSGTAQSAVGAGVRQPGAEPESTYRVDGLETPEARSDVTRQGVDVLGGGRDYLEIRATPEQADRLRAGGLRVLQLPVPALPIPLPGLPLPSQAGDFPAGFTGYHTYDELTTELAALAEAHPEVVALSSYGRSDEGRALPLMKISDEVGTDETEPEVLFSCAQHAREHLTAEMCLHIVTRLAEGYGTDSSITDLVGSREIWVMPMTNPDGAEYDVANGGFEFWRKNRQPNPGTSAIGTDLNRNWGEQWGCCGGSSTIPADDTYRGPAPFSAPETAQFRDWVTSRVRDGRQQITTHIDFHTYSELVLWPYGFTTDDTAPGLDTDDAATFRTLGEKLAATNGYTPQQSSDLYITDGTVGDWMWAQHHIWSFVFEMYPSSDLQGGFYPPDSVITREVERNDTAVDLLLSVADCVPCSTLP